MTTRETPPASIYRMNFFHMPEFHWLLGYVLAIIMMLTGSFMLYLVFKRAGWL